LIVEVIFGVMIACCKGNTSASAEIISEIGARRAGVASTLTTGAFSLPDEPQPAAHRIATNPAPRSKWR
jgi:hypothetical protein